MRPLVSDAYTYKVCVGGGTREGRIHFAPHKDEPRAGQARLAGAIIEFEFTRKSTMDVATEFTEGFTMDYATDSTNGLDFYKHLADGLDFYYI
jgi:hypothetical protein